MTARTESLARHTFEAADAGITPALYRLIDWLHAARWSSHEARERGLRRLIAAARGSRGVVADAVFARRVARLAIQWCVPTALRSGAAGDTAAHAAYAAANAAAYASRAAVYGIDADAHAAYAAYYAAKAAAHAAAAAAYAGHGVRDDATARAAYDDALTAFAERVVRVLRDLKSPGAEDLPDCD